MALRVGIALAAAAFIALAPASALAQDTVDTVDTEVDAMVDDDRDDGDKGLWGLLGLLGLLAPLFNKKRTDDVYVNRTTTTGTTGTTARNDGNPLT